MRLISFSPSSHPSSSVSRVLLRRPSSSSSDHLNKKCYSDKYLRIIVILLLAYLDYVSHEVMNILKVKTQSLIMLSGITVTFTRLLPPDNNNLAGHCRRYDSSLLFSGRARSLVQGQT